MKFLCIHQNISIMWQPQRGGKEKTLTGWKKKKKGAFTDTLRKHLQQSAIIITATTRVICQQISSGKTSPICVGRTGRAVDKWTAYENKLQGCFTCRLCCRDAFVLEELQSPLAVYSSSRLIFTRDQGLTDKRPALGVLRGQRSPKKYSLGETGSGIQKQNKTHMWKIKRSPKLKRISFTLPLKKKTCKYLYIFIIYKWLYFIILLNINDI